MRDRKLEQEPGRSVAGKEDMREDLRVSCNLSVRLVPIGVIRTSEEVAEKDIPRHFVRLGLGTVEIFPPYEKELADVEGFSHLWLVTLFHKCVGSERKASDASSSEDAHGVFATRTPWRPNPIGLTLVNLLRREGSILHVMGADLLDETPILDIKPFLDDLDCPNGEANSGWYEEENPTG